MTLVFLDENALSIKKVLKRFTFPQIDKEVEGANTIIGRLKRD